LVERANGHLETSFLPGRTFAGPGDFNTQPAGWLHVANRRHHRTIGCRSLERGEADRSAMLGLPPVTPPNWWPLHTRLGRDHYIRVDTCEKACSRSGRRLPKAQGSVTLSSTAAWPHVGLTMPSCSVRQRATGVGQRWRWPPQETESTNPPWESAQNKILLCCSRPLETLVIDA
jgi:hypothetical protein